MKILLTPLLFALALVVTLWVLWRLRCRRVVVLHGRLHPRVVHLVVTLLLVLGLGGRARSQEPPAPERPGGATPARDDVLIVDEATIQAAIYARLEHPAVAELKRALILPWSKPLTPMAYQRATAGAQRMPEALRRLLTRELSARQEGDPIPGCNAEELTAALRIPTRSRPLEGWALAWLWRRSEAATRGAPAEVLRPLFEALHHQARTVHLLDRALATFAPPPVRPGAWGNKSGRPRIPDLDLKTREYLAAARALAPTIALGRFDQLRVRLEVSRDGPPVVLHRGGETRILTPGASVAFGRLDLLAVPGDRAAVLSHPGLGELRIPAHAIVSAWSLPQSLDRGARETLRTAVRAAAHGDAAALRRVEAVLIIALEEIRIALAEEPSAPAAPALRTLQALHDETAR